MTVADVTASTTSQLRTQLSTLQSSVHTVNAELNVTRTRLEVSYIDLKRRLTSQLIDSEKRELLGEIERMTERSKQRNR